MSAVILHSFLIFSCVCYVVSYVEEDYAKDFLAYLNKKMSFLNNKYYLAEWNYSTNLTDYNLLQFMKVSEYVSREVRKDNSHTSRFHWRSYKSENLKRQFRFFTNLDILSLPTKKYTKLNKIISSMQEIYAKAKFCDFFNPKKCDLQLEPHLTEILATSKNYNELKYYWLEWRRVVGINLKSKYIQYVKLINEAARRNHFKDASDMSLSCYELPKIKEVIHNLWLKIQPLYKELHAYIRHKLHEYYGGELVPNTGTIPAWLLGNMWSQSWEFVSNISMPFPKLQTIDVSDEMKRKKYTIKKIFETAQDFFLSLDMSPMPKSFWTKSLLEKPKDREVVCHASAWDFADCKDYRIRQCTRIDHESFVTAHHEMGHVEYYLQYRKQPPIFQSGANPAFHEAVGDTIALSVMSLNHFKKLGLIKSGGKKHSEDAYKKSINYLFLIALTKIPFMPFGYLVDLWRWGVFNGSIKADEYNCQWWKLRVRLQGISPPSKQKESENFDPASKYHVVANYEYIAYFMSHILQFQFHKSLCKISGQYPQKSLHDCDIYGSKRAGKVFKKMLALGGSKPWPQILKILVNSTEMDAGPFIEFFEPLMQWIRKENRRNNAEIGWNKDENYCEK